MNLNIIPTWSEAVNDEFWYLKTVAEEEDIKPEFCFKINNNDIHGTCKYFFGCATQYNKKQISRGIIRMPYISAVGIINDRTIKVRRDIVLVKSLIDNVYDFFSATRYVQIKYPGIFITDYAKQILIENNSYLGDR